MSRDENEPRIGDFLWSPDRLLCNSTLTLKCPGDRTIALGRRHAAYIEIGGKKVLASGVGANAQSSAESLFRRMDSLRASALEGKDGKPYHTHKWIVGAMHLLNEFTERAVA